MIVGAVACGGAATLKTLENCFKTAVCLSPIIMSELVGVGLGNECVRSSYLCIDASYDDILSKGRLAGKKPVVSETRYFSVLGM